MEFREELLKFKLLVGKHLLEHESDVELENINFDQEIDEFYKIHFGENVTPLFLKRRSASSLS